MVRNAIWLNAFVAFYLAFVAFIPQVIGKRVVAIVYPGLCSLSQGLVDMGYLSAFPAYRNKYTTLLRQLLEAIPEVVTPPDVPIHYLDLVYIAMGYLASVAFIFVLAILFPVPETATLRRTPSVVPNPGRGVADPAAMAQEDAETAAASTSSMYRVVCTRIQRLAIITKVSLLLLLRILLLPLCQGLLLLATLGAQVLPFTVQDWAEFIAGNPIGMLSLSWVSGITFMLSMTITILQLREVLHPCYLARLIRPQEAHAELMHSLLQETAWVHMKRTATSCAVYTALQLLLVAAPLGCIGAGLRMARIAHCRGGAGGGAAEGVYAMLSTWHTWHTWHTWYTFPILQIPAELLALHLGYLTCLEKHKERLGKGMHHLLVKSCGALGVSRLVLPHVYVLTEDEDEDEDEDEGKGRGRGRGRGRGNGRDRRRRRREVSYTAAVHRPAQSQKHWI
jgi:E3 ubiquitin-protein ligase MARCH6